MEDEEVGVQLIVVDQLHPDLVFPMRKRAKDIILTVCTIVGIMGAELRFVLLEAVELLHLVVAFVAVVSPRTREIVVLILDILNHQNSTFWATEHSSLVTGIFILRLSLLEW